MDGHTNSEQIDDVNVLVSELQARVSMLERENQQVKEHTKKQSREIQIMKQQKEGIEVWAIGWVQLFTIMNPISSDSTLSTCGSIFKLKWWSRILSGSILSSSNLIVTVVNWNHFTSSS